MEVWGVSGEQQLVCFLLHTCELLRYVQTVAHMWMCLKSLQIFVTDAIDFCFFIYLPCYHSHSASILISITRNHLYIQMLSRFIIYIISSKVSVYLMSVREMKAN